MPRTAKPPDIHKPNTFLARDMCCLKNGSLYRKTRCKGEYAFYCGGDFIDFVTEVPLEELKVVMPGKEARNHLPGCFRGN